ncbi:MAG TPA: hypothetical protein VIH96_01695 [Paraburkholderia sp.]|jgi:hypothetical protein
MQDSIRRLDRAENENSNPGPVKIKKRATSYALASRPWQQGERPVDRLNGHFPEHFQALLIGPLN